VRKNWILLVCVAGLLMANAPADAGTDPVVGRWVFEAPGDRRVLVLRSDSHFELDVRRTPGAVRATGTWRAGAGRLTLTSADPAFGESTTSLVLTADTLTLENIPADGKAMTYRRDAGLLVGQWTDAGGTVRLEFRKDGGFVRVHTEGGRAEGAYEASYEEPAATRGTVRIQLAGEAPVPGVFRLDQKGTRLFLSEPDQQATALEFVRVTETTVRAPTFVGRWESRTAGGTTVLVVAAREDGSYLLLADGESIVARTTPEGRLEGRQTVGEVTAAIALALDGERLVAHFSFFRPDAARQDLDPIVFVRSAEPRPGTQARDAALVGHWRFTSVEHFVIDFNLSLGTDGRYRWWIVPSEEAPETGVWRTEGGRLFLHALSAGSERLFGAYALGEGARVMLITRPDGQKRPYTRQ
jgi:hypothetical protein